MFSLDNAEWVPESLDTMEPGHELACVLSAINVGDCTGHDRIRVLKAHERMRSFHSAQLYQAMNAVIDAVDTDDMAGDLAEEAASAEVAAALKWTRRTADSEMGFALDLRRRLPDVWMALWSGKIDLRRAKVMVRATSHLPTASAQNIVDSIIDRADRFTTGQLNAKLRKLCIETEPDDAARRYEAAVAERRVTAQPDEAGTAHLFAMDLPPHRLAAGMNRINRLAQSLRRPGETRTMDQLRADVLLDVLEGTGVATAGGRGTTIIHTTLESLAGLANHPGELAGYGPVATDIARQVAERQQGGTWSWVIEDPETGLPLATGTTRRRPTAQQQRDVEARNPTCTHPGCRMPAAESDLDHRIPWAHQRRTHSDNLAPLCRYHHRIKHEAGWNYKAVGGGDYVFTTPLGHNYTTSGRSP
ncbi:MAG: DUF222 domain-containing protein [bacterium]|nr:DUF222 domain-containing protein [bacterium]